MRCEALHGRVGTAGDLNVGLNDGVDESTGGQRAATRGTCVQPVLNEHQHQHQDEQDKDEEEEKGHSPEHCPH